MTEVLVEACVDAIDAALEAERGGAGRIELCGELLQGGVTPSAGLVAAVWDRIDIPLFVLIRPRAGDFLYTDDELDVMRRDIEQMKALGVDGVAVGALTASGDVDEATMRLLIELARPMAVTFHRAFDFVRDQDSALGSLLALGVDRVLTSGGAATALDGTSAIGRMVQRVGERMIVMAGGSVTAANVAEVVAGSGVKEVHVRGAARVESAMTHRRQAVSLSKSGGSDYDRSVTRADEIRRVVERAARSSAEVHRGSALDGIPGGEST
jgi:copper homeostasis protein